MIIKIKKVLPKVIIKICHNILLYLKYKNKTTQEIFTTIYNDNHWKSSESISGGGSELEQTNSVIKEVNIILKSYSIKSILDIPCGDFNWMRFVDLAETKYIGADIVDKLILNNSNSYSINKQIDFKVINLITDKLPKVDLVITRDCLVHLSFKDIFKSIANIKNSGSKYLLTTTFTNRHNNIDIITGSWRTLNLEIAPFNFPKPIALFIENCTEDNGNFSDKAMALYNIEDIKN